MTTRARSNDAPRPTRRVHDQLIVAYAGRPYTIITNDSFASTSPGVPVKQLLAGAGALAIIVLICWLVFQGGAKLVSIGAEDARIASIAEYTPKEEALKLQIFENKVAMEAGTFLINQSVLSGKLTSKKLLVCVYGAAPSGSLKYEPEMGSDYNACSKGHYTVTFPVTYDAFGKATIGTPTVTR